MDISREEIEQTFQRLKEEAESTGYFFNPDEDFVKDLVSGLLVNARRYGYPLCPCRLTSGNKDDDLDLICPCDYRDDDLTEYGNCFCSLYVSPEIANGEKKPHSIPERRAGKRPEGSEGLRLEGLFKYPIWRCKVCGYLCAREKPPLICPICKAGKERFERFV